ncbi:MAG: leucine-rich repeat domain-containing protein, partial [Chloroflexota bacterium]
MRFIIRITLFTTICFVYVSVLHDAVTAQIQPQQTSFDCAAVSEIPQIECEALVAIYNRTEGSGWIRNDNWLRTMSPCGWYGVTCSSRRVTSLDLDNDNMGNNLKGALPAAIGDFVSLTYLDLSDNQLNHIPSEIGNLSNLSQLWLSWNLLDSIPIEIGNLSNLVVLSFYNNHIRTIPTEMGNLSNLSWLYLDNNQLTNIPTEISKLTNLTYLFLSSNQLSSIPVEIGNLSNLS